MSFSLMMMAAAEVMAESATIELDMDSLSLEQLNEVIIEGVRAHENEPFATTNIDRSDLDSYSKSGRELPYLFSRTPGVISWSDNGTGTDR